MFATHLRTTAVALCNNMGRVITAPGPLVAGVLAAYFGGSFAIATTAIASTVVVAILALAFARETHSQFMHDLSPS